MDQTAADAPRLDDLDATLRQAWRLLARGVADRRCALHTVQLATIGLDGAPRLRTVVLRGVDAQAGVLRIHTDARSAKIAELAADPRAALHGYDARAKVQIRIDGRMASHADDAVADAAWAATGAGSRMTYRAAIAPGAGIDHPALADPAPATDDNDPDAGRSVFRALTLTAARLEWLHLAAGGHRRAAFVRDGALWRGQWLAP